MDEVRELSNLQAPDRLPSSSTHELATSNEEPTLIPGPISAQDDGPRPPDLRTWRFWAIIMALGITGLMSAIEGTIITSALPTITNALGGGDAYIWVPNAYLLAQVAILPLAGQASNIFGRRHLLLAAVALFTLGGGLSGGASSMGMLIAARTIQGLGGGGINLLMETIVTDIVPLRERGQYMAIVGIGAVVGATLGPFLGGLITDHASWRWCFYINVPIGVASFAILFVFLRVKYDRDLTWSSRLRRIDISGNAIFVAAIVSALIALTWGGTIYSWSTYHIWTPRLCPEPSFPRQIVSNRTSAAALVLTFIHAVVAYWAYYFLPIYFQAVRALSPLRSGIYTLPNVAGGLVFAVLGGVLLSKFGRYKPLHLAGFAVTTISFGLLSILDAHSSDAAWVCIQLLNALGSGMLSGVLLPAVQAPLDESYVATATGVWSFARYFGCIWGVTIPSAVFNNECRRLASTVITDEDIASKLSGDSAYQHATGAFLLSIQDPELRAEVIRVFTGAMRTVWLVGIAFAALGFLVSFVAKEIQLREELHNDFGVEDKKDAAVSSTANIEVPSSDPV
ncbi:MFS general substrate transporter [Trichoderma citrinoviride]|uniref:MFS general substrate transporter n=1 Tax=Trichoderma citrinoviride TaxID=58853 RepID=A0A2T4B993_9HYPO|nr:MFS general substrate transporter [Trichoderma citrinoviride]PTB65895.1 MFS general substrate transporter [Trichoderma citrinoviride]